MSEAVMGIWLSLVRLAGTGGGEESLSDGEHVQPASPPRAPAAKEMEGGPILLLLSLHLATVSMRVGHNYVHTTSKC